MRERPVRHLPEAETIEDYLRRFDEAMMDFAECARSRPPG